MGVHFQKVRPQAAQARNRLLEIIKKVFVWEFMVSS